MGNPLATAPCSVRLVMNGVPQKSSYPFRGGVITAWRFGVWNDGGVGTSFTKEAYPVSGSNRVFFTVGQGPGEVPSINYQLNSGTGFAADTPINAVVDDLGIGSCRVLAGSAKIFLPPGLPLTSAEVVNASLHVSGLYLTSNTRAVSLAADTVRSCTMVSGSATLSHSTTTAITVGSRVSGDGIPAGAYVVSSTTTTAVINVPATSNTVASIAFGGSIETAESVSATRVSGNTVISYTARQPVSVGAIVSGTGITAGTYVVSSTTTTATLSAVATASGTSSLTFTPTATADAEVSLTIAGHLIVAASATAFGVPANYTLESVASSGLWPNPSTSIREGDLVAIAMPWGYSYASGAKYHFYRTVYGYIGGIDTQLGFSFLLFRNAELTTVDDSWWDDDNWFLNLRTDEPIYATVISTANVTQSPTAGIARLSVSSPPLAVLGGAISVTTSATLQTAATMRFVNAAEEVSVRSFASLRITQPAFRNLRVDLFCDTRAKLNLSLPRLRGAPVRPRIPALSLGAASRVEVSLRPDIAVRSSAALNVSTPRLRGNTSLRCYVQFASRIALKMVIETDAINVRQLAGQVMSMWSKSSLEQANRLEFRQQFISDLNAAMQEIYSAAERLNYFNRATEQVTVGAGNSSVALPSTVQKVLGEVRVSASKQSLWACASLSELHQNASLYPGATSPQVYFLDARSQPDTQATAMTLHVAPPKASGTLVLDLEVVHRAPRYSWADVEQATQVRLPHAYAETLLIPLLRYRASVFRYFFDEKLKPEILSQYQQARQLLGNYEPAPEAGAVKPQPQTQTA